MGPSLSAVSYEWNDGWTSPCSITAVRTNTHLPDPTRLGRVPSWHRACTDASYSSFSLAYISVTFRKIHHQPSASSRRTLRTGAVHSREGSRDETEESTTSVTLTVFTCGEHERIYYQVDYPIANSTCHRHPAATTTATTRAARASAQHPNRNPV